MKTPKTSKTIAQEAGFKPSWTRAEQLAFARRQAVAMLSSVQSAEDALAAGNDAEVVEHIETMFEDAEMLLKRLAMRDVCSSDGTVIEQIEY